MAAWHTGDTQLIREALRDVTGRVPAPAAVLLERASERFGDPICERRLWRALRWLEERGEDD